MNLRLSTGISGQGAAARPSPPLEAPSRRYGEKLIGLGLGLCALLSVLTTTAIVVSLLIPTADFFDKVGFTEFLFGTEWGPSFSPASFGVLPILAGTLSTSLWGMLFAVPIGLAAAIWLSEYSSPRARRLVKPAIEVLAGIPTVAIGIFGLVFLSPVIERIFPFMVQLPPFSAGVAGLAIGLMLVPIIASISDDAMRSVPAGLREAAYGLGATRMKVATRVVFPAAISGVIASLVLAGSRAVGETMVVLLVAGASPNLTFDPGSSVLTMTSFIAQTATGDISTGSITYDTIFAVGALLFVLTLAMNAIAIRLVRRFREVYE
ncbi:MAG: phosphate ABC transporter permease subunit PstC [Solirubrobacterales bacterium]|nr:phosphate ABC transporter permease subunit PstC [Solirubrobacterales bacterium]